MKNLRETLKHFSDAMGGVFVCILVGLVLMALGRLFSLF